MKAVFIESQGGVEVLQYGDLPEPQIGLHDVKVRVGACALNRLDVYTRSGARGPIRSCKPRRSSTRPTSNWYGSARCAGRVARISSVSPRS